MSRFTSNSRTATRHLTFSPLASLGTTTHSTTKHEISSCTGGRIHCRTHRPHSHHRHRGPRGRRHRSWYQQRAPRCPRNHQCSTPRTPSTNATLSPILSHPRKYHKMLCHHRRRRRPSVSRCRRLCATLRHPIRRHGRTAVGVMATSRSGRAHMCPARPCCRRA